MGSDNTDHIPVPKPVADLLNRVAVEWVPPRFADRNVERLEWSGEDLSAQARRLRVSKQQLEILCSLPTMSIAEARATKNEIPFAELRGELAGRTEDGLSFSASQGMTNNSTQRAHGSSVDTDFFIQIHDWSIWSEERPARLWVAPIELKSTDHHFGNLLLSSGRGSSWGNFRLQGSLYVYYLLNLGAEKRRQLIAIDTQGAPHPDPHLVRRELTYLSFSFGESIATDNLLGLDEGGHLVGSVGGTFAGRAVGQWWDSVVPMFEHKRCWVAPLFHRLCDFHSTRQTSELGELTLGIWYLLSSYRETSADIRRTEVFVGLTCLARFVEANQIVLADVPAWDAWLSSARASIDDIASKDAQDVLFEQLRRANIADSVSLVSLAMRRVGLGILPTIQGELRAAAEGLRGQPLIQSNTIDHAAMLRSVLVALVAKTIGYDGAIAGWERVGNYFYWGRADPAWWPVPAKAEIEARTIYAAKTAAGPVAVKDLWPTFSLLTVPNAGPIGSLVSFATALALKTGGSVAAKVVPVPREDNVQPQYFDFVLYSIENPRTRSVLFTAYEKDAQTLVVVDWEDVDITVDVNQEMESLLERIANSAETRLRIERLALAAQLGDA